MRIQQSIHNVAHVFVDAESTQALSGYKRKLCVVDENGDRFDVTLYSDEPIKLDTESDSASVSATGAEVEIKAQRYEDENGGDDGTQGAKLLPQPPRPPSPAAAVRIRTPDSVTS